MSANRNKEAGTATATIMKRSCSLDNVTDDHHSLSSSLATKQHGSCQDHDKEVNKESDSHTLSRSKSLDMLAIVCDRVIPRMGLYGPNCDRTRSISWTMNYKTALANDNLVIIETPKTSTPTPSVCSISSTSSLGQQSPSPTPSTVASDDVELPKPDTVRKARDTFETLARKTAHEAAVEQERQKVRRSVSSPSPTYAYLKKNGHSVNSPDSRSSSPQESASPMIRPDYQIFANFSESSVQAEAETEWKDRDRGSPVSPHVIRKLREYGTSVTYFGGRSYVSDSEEDDYDGERSNEDDLDVDVLNPQDSSSSPVFFSFSWPRSRTPSPTSPKVIGVLCKNEKSLKGHPGIIQLRRGYSTTEPGTNVNHTVMVHNGHGVWNPNPRWLGSYFTRFNFTQPMSPNGIHTVLEMFPRKKLSPDKYPPLLTSNFSYSSSSDLSQT